MIDYSALLFDPAFGLLGVPAMMTTTAGVFDITVIDETRAKSHASGQMDTRSVGPAACVRIPELTAKGVDRSDYLGSVLSFNGRMWTIRNFDSLGSPNGDDAGLVRFYLKASE